MKYVTIILALILVALVTVTAIVMMTSEVQVSMAGIRASEARDDPALFAQVIRAAGGDTQTEDINDYKFFTWRVTVRNGTHIPLEIVEATITTQTGDVARVDESAGIRIEPRADGELTVKILTRGEVTPGHEITVSWYMWGQSYRQTIRV